MVKNTKMGTGEKSRASLICSFCVPQVHFALFPCPPSMQWHTHWSVYSSKRLIFFKSTKQEPIPYSDHVQPDTLNYYQCHINSFICSWIKQSAIFLCSFAPSSCNCNGVIPPSPFLPSSVEKLSHPVHTSWLPFWSQISCMWLLKAKFDMYWRQQVLF